MIVNSECSTQHVGLVMFRAEYLSIRAAALAYHNSIVCFQLNSTLVFDTRRDFLQEQYICLIFHTAWKPHICVNS